MKFFVPYAKDDEQAQDVWQGVKKFAEQNLIGWFVNDKRVRRLEYVHNHHRRSACVGQPSYDEEVIIIFEATTLYNQFAYLVCTPSRGVVRGEPLFISATKVESVEYFE